MAYQVGTAIVGTKVGRMLLLIEVLICFGPAGVMLLLGALLFPVWTAMLIAYLLGFPIDNSDGLLPWVLIAPMLMVAGGVSGAIGLARVLWLLTRTPRHSSGHRPTLVAVVAGLLGLFLFNLYELVPSGVKDMNDVVALALLGGLPLASSAHLLFLARHVLLGKSLPGAGGAVVHEEAPNNALQTDAMLPAV